jgi:5-methylcytosine-specific restriction endonuclease McrBC GTP-binding regulatory subunit McrB
MEAREYAMHGGYKTMNTAVGAILIAVAIEAVKRVFAMLGKPLPANVQFLISLLSPIVPILAGGSYTSLTEAVRVFGEFFAAVQGVYNAAKAIGRLYRQFRSQ